MPRVTTSRGLRSASAPRVKRKPSHRLVKTHRNYTVDEVAALLGVAKVTVRRWIKSGALPAVIEKKPALILGGDLADFLKTRSAKGPKLLLNQCYCFKCRGARSPALKMADYIPRSLTLGTLRALCEVCSTVMNKAISKSALIELNGVLELTIQQAERHLIDTSQASLNDHLLKEPHPHA